MRKSDALKALSKAQSEVQLWKSRFETEGMGKIEELETARNKLQGRIVEAEENVDAMNLKIANTEKSRVRTAAAMKGGKAAMAKLENRIHELEAELGSVQSRT